MPNNFCWPIVMTCLCLTLVVGPWPRLIWLCQVNIIGYRGLIECRFHLPKWMNNINLVKVLLCPIWVLIHSPPSSSHSPSLCIHIMDLWYLYILRLVDCKINISMDEIRPPLLHILFVCGMFHEHSSSYYVSNMH